MPDPTTVDYGAQIDSVEPTTKERVLKGIGGAVAGATGASSAGLDAQIEKHQQARLNEARMHRKNASTYAAILATGKDPATGQALSPEDEQKYQDWYNASMAAYEKAAGVNKETKGAIGKAKVLAEHIIGMGRKQREGVRSTAGAGGAGAQPVGGLSPPPQRAAAVGAASTGDASADASPSVAATGGRGLAPPPGYTPQVAMGGGELAQQVEDNRKLENYKRMQQILYDEKVREDAAKAKAKQQSTPRPVKSNAISVLDARTLADSGKIFVDGEGNAIDVNNLPETMGLISFVVKNPDNGQWETVYQPFSPNQSALTVGGETYAISPMDKSKLTQGKGTDLGAHNIPSTSATTDPTTRQTTVTKRTPTITGAAGRGGITPPPSGQPRAKAAPTQRPTRDAAAASGTGAAVPVDSDGHISSTWNGASPQVIEGANQLHDGMDLKDIGGTTKTKPLSEALARKAWGWSRDKFTPLEHQQIALASRYIQEAIKSPSLKSLDADFISQLPMIGASGDTAKESRFGKALTKLSAQATTPAQAEFLRLYRQMAGTISGIGRLSRGGRVTEATVNRLLSELPNPANTKNSADAIARLQRLQDEINTALSHDSYEELASGRAGASTSSGGGGGERQKWIRDTQGKIVPAPATAGP